MTDSEPSSAWDARFTGWLRRLYAAPADPVYWRSLESSIMERISELDLGWWTELDRWKRPALAAAAALMLAAGVLMYRAREAESTRVYRDLVAPADAPGAQPADVAPAGPRETTLRSIVGRT